jgi:hypothetical protein
MSDSCYQLVAFLHIANQKKGFQLVQPYDVVGRLTAARQAGHILTTMCSSDSELELVIQAVSIVSDSQFTSPDFRLFVLVHGITLGSVTGFSTIFDECDLISIDCPMTIKVCMSSTLSAVQGMKFDPFIPKLSFFDAAVSVIKRLTLFTPFPSFYNFELALQCAGDADSSGHFVCKYIYELSDDNFWEYFVKGDMEGDYPLPYSFSPRTIGQCLDQFPLLDDPFVFGYPRHAFSVFHDKLMEVEPEFDDFNVELIQCDPKFRTEVFLLSLMTATGHRIPNLERRYGQIRENDEVVDFSLLVAPDVFIAILKYLFMKDWPVAVDPVIVLDDPDKKRKGPGGVLVNGLMTQNSKWKSGKLEKHPGGSSLPELWMHAAEAPPPGYLGAEFLQYGVGVGAIFLPRGASLEDEIVRVFPQPV